MCRPDHQIPGNSTRILEAEQERAFPEWCWKVIITTLCEESAMPLLGKQGLPAELPPYNDSYVCHV